MADPVTIGTLAAAALTAGASALGKEAISAATKDSYAALKEVLLPASPRNVEKLEADPDAQHRALSLAEDVDELDPAKQAKVNVLAEALREALAAEGKGDAVSMMINQFNNYGGQQFNAPGGTQNISAVPPKPEE